MDLLRRTGVAHTVHEYVTGSPARSDRDERSGYGLEAAAALGVDPTRVFKTLVATLDDRHIAAVVPVAGELDLKRLADAAGGRRAAMADAAAAERASGSVIGGISPLGMRRPLPTVVDASALELRTMFVSGGRRGLQVELAPADLVRLTAATVASIARPR